MANSELVAYLRANLPKFGPEAMRKQLRQDGVAAAEIDAALAEALPPRKKRLAAIALGGGALLLVLAVLMSMQAPPPKTAADSAATDEGDGVYRGHYGYILKLPPGYQAYGTFRDPKKTQELVYIYPKGTDHSHFIHEGLYGNLGILRLEAVPRRVPQGFVGIETLEAFVKHGLDQKKATYKIRSLIVNGLPSFVVNVEKPFKYVRAYIVGQKIRYTLVGGEENTLFIEVLSSLLEAAPHDRPGR